MARPHIRLGEGRWNLWRLSDDEFRSLGEHALPIVQNFELLAKWDELEASSEDPPFLPLAFVALERTFGPSSLRFDAYRSSFSFPLLLTFARQRRCSYLLRCHDHRGIVYYPLYRVVSYDPTPEERSFYHVPANEEFARAEMDEFVTCLRNHLLDFGRTLTTALVAPFYRAIRSDALLHGFDGTQFFEQTFPSALEFDRAREELDARLDLVRHHGSSNRVERFIDWVTEVPA
jgi:hypothetical protein